MMKKFKKFLTRVLVILLVSGVSQTLWAAKLVELKVVDKDYLMLHFKDGEVKFVDDGKGTGAHAGTSDEPKNNFVVSYGKALDMTNAVDVRNWIIKSDNDSRYGAAGTSPKAIYRTSRVNGMAYTGWDPVNSDHGFNYTNEHFIYLGMPSSMEPGKNYTVEINGNINSDSSSQTLTFDIFNCPSEAIHTNLVGYMSSSRIKAADLYHFLGDGGNRDYSGFVGKKVYIYNVATKESQPVGSVTFWMKNKNETQWNLTGSDVWNIDFTGFSLPGTYRLAVEDVGCSENFEIKDDIYHDPYKLAVLGYFYMRIGQDNLNMIPVPRRPLYIQDKDPANCKIYVTDMHPYHPKWETFASGDKWDQPASWMIYRKAGNPTNPNAIGGHSDALDWDRHLGHVVNIYDLCLAYILSNGALNDDDLRIAESGNGIPDILDEARNEVDFWLNLRYNGGYSHGLTNPDGSNRLYQADNTPIAAWANALNSAMLAYCFQIAGLNELRTTYKDSAIIAYNYANKLPDQMLNTLMEGIRGVDFKMMTAAFLYNLTGDITYEAVVKKESMVISSSSSIYQQGSYNQLWGTAAYLLSKREIHYLDLHKNMKAAIIAEARSKETENVTKRPSRRGYSNEQAWWQTNQDMARTVLAHAVTDNPTDKLTFLDALLLEADWGLGRNPLNMIQMTTATTELAAKRSVENCYTSGRDDGSPGLHPGHTPYLNTEGWGGTMVGSNPLKVLQRFYPAISNWPHAAKYINTRFIWAHSEFTPRETMRGKALIYAYLYNLSKSGGHITPILVADAGPDQRIIDEDGDGKAKVHLDASGSYSSQSEITSYKWHLNDKELAAGKTAQVELEIGNYSIILKVQNANGESATDTVKINITSKSSSQKADYDFETAGQFNEWYAQNGGKKGGTPLASRSTEKAYTGSYSYKIKGNFVPESEIVLRHDGQLADGIRTLIYHVWLPQAIVDSAKAMYTRDSTQVGGMQCFLMHTSWQWISQWYTLKDLKGDAWNKVELIIPENVKNSSIQAIGATIKPIGVNAGENSVYIDDIFFEIPTAVKEPDAKLALLPEEFKLFPNYPNPFNPETKIRYNIPQNTRVNINVYNLAGHQVKNLVNGNKDAGSYEVIFDGHDLASGVYFYSLEAGAYRDVKKLILLK